MLPIQKLINSTRITSQKKGQGSEAHSNFLNQRKVAMNKGKVI